MIKIFAAGSRNVLSSVPFEATSRKHYFVTLGTSESYVEGAIEYSIQRYDWRILISDYIEGTCLNFAVEDGTQSLLLAELCSEVISIDDSVDRLMRVKKRTDYESITNVDWVNASFDSLPFESSSFDVIVATAPKCAKWFVGNGKMERVRKLRELLTEEGKLIVLAEGLPLLTGFYSDSQISEGMPLFDRLRKTTQVTASQYKQLFNDVGFSNVEMLTMLPNSTSPRYTFRTDDNKSVSWVLNRRKISTKNKILSRLSTMAHKFNLLTEVFPTFLLACSVNDDPLTLFSGRDLSGHVLSHGRSRGVLLRTDGRNIKEVTKVPNRKRHEQITIRENEVLQELRKNCNESIINTLPEGNIHKTRFGYARVESPVCGHPLPQDVRTSKKSFQRILQTGLEWILDLQNSTENRRSAVVDLREDLTVSELGIEPPAVDLPDQMIRVPVHGDCHPQNFFVSDGKITSVIDWEHSVRYGNPIIDPSYLLLQTAKFFFTGRQEAFNKVFLEDTVHNSIASKYIQKYCTTIGIKRDTFELFIPSGVIHQLKIENEINTAASYTSTMDEKSEWVEYMWENLGYR